MALKMTIMLSLLLYNDAKRALGIFVLILIGSLLAAALSAKLAGALLARRPQAVSARPSRPSRSKGRAKLH
jgi:hypothetical protein